MNDFLVALFGAVLGALYGIFAPFIGVAAVVYAFADQSLPEAFRTAFIASYAFAAELKRRIDKGRLEQCCREDEEEDEE